MTANELIWVCYFSLISLLLLFLWYKRLAAANRELAEVKANLDTLVSARTAELSKTNQQLVTEVNQHKQTEEQLTQLNQELEQHINQRLTDLRQANLFLKSQIAERRQVELQLRQSQQLLQLVMDNIPQLIFWKDRNSVYLGCNQSFATVAGVGSPANIVGKTDYDLPWKPQETEWFRHCDRRVMTSDTAELGIVEPILQSDGQQNWVETNKIPLHDSAGKVVGILGTSEDITHRVQAEVTLKQLNEELERRVEKRTLELRQAIEQLEHEISDRKRAEEALRQSEMRLRQQTEQLEQTLQQLQRTQAQLIQSEKMSNLGQLVAGVAHEINNPVNFIHGNLVPASEYVHDLLDLLQEYQQHYPNPVPELQRKIAAIDLDFLLSDLPKLLTSMETGTERICKIVQSLRTFSRLDEAELKIVDLHLSLDSTLMILQNRLKARSKRPAIEIVKRYGSLPPVECYAGQLNQVFMNILSNAIDALEDCYCETLTAVLTKPVITIETYAIDQTVTIQISDNGIGMSEAVQQRLFDPFFTTKPVGQGTGMGLSVSYQIVVEKHGGQLECMSALGAGTTLTLSIPVEQSATSLPVAPLNR